MPRGAAQLEDLQDAVRAVESRGSATSDLPPLDAAAHAAAKKGLSLLAIRPRSAHELTERLLAHEHAPEAVDEAMARLRVWGLVDDADFAREWVNGRRHRRGKSSGALRLELQRKGVEARHIEAALEGIDTEDEVEKARELVRGRLSRLSRPVPTSDEESLRTRRRLVAYLERRGFPGGLALRVVGEELDNLREAAAAD